MVLIPAVGSSSHLVESTGVAGGSAKGFSLGESAGDGGIVSSVLPPLLTGGSESAESGDSDLKTRFGFHLDYLALTVHGTETELDSFEESLVEVFGLGQPIRRPEMGRWAVQDAYGAGADGKGAKLLALRPKAGGEHSTGWRCFWLGGEGCAAITCKGWETMVDLVKRYDRVVCTRLDGAWDGGPVSPGQVDEWLRAGKFKTRHKRSFEFLQNEQGSTAYFPARSDKGFSMLRVYDKRGFNRVELQINKPWAPWLWTSLVARPVDEWAGVFLRELVRHVDFVDVKGDEQACRAPRFPVWQDLVQDAEALKRQQPPADSPRRTAAGRSEAWMMRNAKQAYAIIQGMGDERFLRRIELYGQPKQDEACRQFSDDLAGFSGSGIAGFELGGADHVVKHEDLPF